MTLNIDIDVYELSDTEFALKVTSADDATVMFFQDRELDGGGYTWHALADLLVRTFMVDDLSGFNFCPEAEDLLVVSADRRALERLEGLIIQKATSEEAVLALIKNINTDLVN